MPTIFIPSKTDKSGRYHIKIDDLKVFEKYLAEWQTVAVQRTAEQNSKKGWLSRAWAEIKGNGAPQEMKADKALIDDMLVKLKGHISAVFYDQYGPVYYDGKPDPVRNRWHMTNSPESEPAIRYFHSNGNISFYQCFTGAGACIRCNGGEYDLHKVHYDETGFPTRGVYMSIVGVETTISDVKLYHQGMQATKVERERKAKEKQDKETRFKTEQTSIGTRIQSHDPNIKFKL